MPGAPNGAVFRETVDSAERHAKWARLEAQGWTRARIAEEEGVARSTIKRGIESLLAAVKVGAAEELRAQSRERLRLILERLFDELAELARPHPLVRDGQRHDDLTDIGSVVALLREVRATDESLRKLDGLDAPTRRVVEVITDDMVNQAIAQEIAAMEALDAGRSADRETATSA